MLQTTEHAYIVTDDRILRGEPIIKGTRTPVRAIVELWRLGISPEEVPRRLLHVSLAQVFDALSYYSDHQQEINGYIEHNRIPDEMIDPLVRDAWSHASSIVHPAVSLKKAQDRPNLAGSQSCNIV